MPSPNEITCVVVEDEPHGQEMLLKCLAKFDDLKLLGVASTAKQANLLFHQLRPDLLFLDMKLPGASGLDLLNLLPDPLPMVIAVTAFEEYAVKAFEYALVDYLTKPIDFARFEQAIGRVRQFIAQKQDKASYRVSSFEEQTGRDHLVIEISQDKFIVPYIHIHYIESNENYVHVHVLPSLKQPPFMWRKKISDLENELPKSLFIRIQRRFIVARSQIYASRKQDVTLLSGVTIKVGPQYRSLLA